jgi:hypothetical protein
MLFLSNAKNIIRIMTKIPSTKHKMGILIPSMIRHGTKCDPTKMLVKNSNTLYEVMNWKKKATINQQGNKLS